MAQTTYSEFFYEEMKDTSLASARAVMPIVLDIVRPKSVIDIGCGTGNWLRACKEQGVSIIQGFDGSWVKTKELVIPQESFKSIDLEKPFAIDIHADLVICLEVAEHVPHQVAPVIVANLVKVAPVILFSAAIPLQGGSHHVNEQWPAYWEKLFAEKGYVPVDCIRRKIWNNLQVSFFYAQNILIYVDKKKIDSYPELKKEIDMGHNVALPLIHPHMYLYYAERWRLLVPFLGRISPKILHSLKRLLKRFK